MPRNTRPILHCGRCGRPCTSAEKLRGHERRAHRPPVEEEHGPARPGIDYPAPDGKAFKAMTERSRDGITTPHDPRAALKPMRTFNSERTARRG